MIQSGTDKQLLDAIRTAKPGTTVWIAARCYRMTEPDVWYRYHPTKDKIKLRFGSFTSEQILNKALDFINVTGYNSLGDD